MGGCQRGEKWMGERNRYKLSVAKDMNHRYEIYSVGKMVNSNAYILCHAVS